MQEQDYAPGWTLDKTEAASARRVLAALEAAAASDGRLRVVWETYASNIRRELFTEGPSAAR